MSTSSAPRSIGTTRPSPSNGVKPSTLLPFGFPHHITRFHCPSVVKPALATTAFGRGRLTRSNHGWIHWNLLKKEDFQMPKKLSWSLATTGVLSGWITGDIGEGQPNGAMKVTDRKKNIFKLSQGEYVALESIESKYLQCLLITLKRSWRTGQLSII
ncbi:long chain acyl-CoA synthetase 4 isoform X2 [Rosa chinensis]|uniref:long chain acyl-CoA synthetase 4 isoform X2 n=1 Tax=Rosa chinensis TaxID=74649 RepID=UPI000D090597|nr:long chain acyl-CoA synthetase 4 isoform X2 [Rosa chinensis]